MRRSAIAYAAFLAALACAPALVQAYPAKAIRMIMRIALAESWKRKRAS